ncbi:MAG: class B sortase [Oscillospiraceae bacterium]|nr:class B sortase [Oscillospiraceae bacterium]
MLKLWKFLNNLYEKLLLLVSVLLLVIGVWQIADNYYLYENANDRSILKYKPGNALSDTSDAPPISDDMVGWLTLDGTAIDYPVMQAADNTYYLRTDPFGSYAATGSIFLDSRCSSDFSDPYSMIYGHHMDYGTLFGALDDYLNASYLNTHRNGTLSVGKDGKKQYDLEVFASMIVSAHEETVYNLDSGRIRQFIAEHAPVYNGAKEGRILGLSTCLNTGSLSRIVVFCYLKE